MPMIHANGTRFHCLQAGSGPDLVMLHGLSGNLAAWHLGLVPALQSRFRITTYDLRGHGHSEITPSGYTTRNMAEDLHALLSVLGIDQAHVLGHSYGADIALHFALLYPEQARSLTLIEPGIPALLFDRQHGGWQGWQHWAQVLEQLSGEPVPPELRNDVRYMMKRSVAIPVMYGPAKGRPRRHDRITQLLEGTSIAQDYEVVDELTVANLATLPQPKLLIYDSGSAWLSTYDVLKDVLTECTKVLLPSAELRHFAALDSPELVARHLTRFLDGGASEAAHSTSLGAAVS